MITLRGQSEAGRTHHKSIPGNAFRTTEISIACLFGAACWDTFVFGALPGERL